MKNLVIILIIVLVSIITYFQYAAHKRYKHPHIKRLVEHIKTNYHIVPDGGYTNKQIKEAFLAKGWPKKIINDLMRLLKKEFHNTYNKPLKNRIKEFTVLKIKNG